MATIQILPPALASQIAAGEVVERPASALKELLENSLDAGATRCDVAIEGGGITRLSVVDDGSGMTPQDAALSVERHATSKLRQFEDLSHLPSYGFRGEALPSIASVCRFALETRTRDAALGTRVVVSAGRIESSEVGMPVGTRVELTDLFYNVPARRKFLRSSATEAGHIADVIEAAALSTPSVAFTLLRDGRKAREWLRTSDRASRVALTFEDEELAACRGERGPLRVEAFLGRPERARVGAAGVRLFCNRRPVRDRALLNTLAQAYGSVLERGRYPRGVVYLDLPPELVDVNVHPQKSEVRFADGRAVTDALYQIVSAELARAFSMPTPAGRWARPQPAQERPAEETNQDDGDRVSEVWTRGATGIARHEWSGLGRDGSSATEPSAATPTDSVVDGAFETVTTPLPAPFAAHDSKTDASTTLSAADGGANEGWQAGTGHLGRPRERLQSFMRIHEAPPMQAAARGVVTESDVSFGKLRYVAQVRGTYLICEGDEGLFVLDQHAAAERVNFHKLKQEYAQQKMASQALLFPVTLQLTAEQAELVTEHEPDITALGFDVRIHSETTVSVHRVPRLLQRDSTERLFLDLLNELGRAGRGFSAAVDAALSTIACHGSVRAGDVLNAPQAEALLKSLDGVDFAGHCPHGRPIVSFTSWSELERKVGRR